MAYPIFGIVLTIGAMLFYLATVRPIAAVLAARNWVEVPCTITHSEVDTDVDSDGTTYAIDIQYEYEFQGRRYHGDRYDCLGRLFSSGRSRKQAVVDRYPVGKAATCYVNPKDPDKAVLNRSLSAAMGIGALGLPFMLIGTVGLMYTVGIVGKKGTSSTATVARDHSADELLTGTATIPRAAHPTAPIVLKPSQPPGVTFVVMTFVALFWNGITSIFVYQVVKSFQEGDPEWLLTIFISPFVLVGLVLVAVVLHSFGALFNPRPVVTLSRGEIPLGQSATVSWRFTGNTSAIRLLRITLKGEEKATYRRGTDTMHDSETFWKEVVFESTHPMVIADGKADIQIPSASMHSFQADNNDIAWSIQLAGEIAMRPDVTYDFPITVVPHEQYVD